MHTSNHIPNSVYASFAAMFYPVPAFVDKIDAAAPIAEECVLSDDNVGATGGVNKTLGEVMFNVVSASSKKRYNSVNKMILQYCFEADNNQRTVPTEWALERLVQQNPHRDFNK